MNIVEFAIRRRVTILMLTVALLLFGVVSLLRLKVDLLPDLSYPTLTVRTELPGSAPLEVENLITRPVEEAVGIIRNVRHVRSVSRSGQSDVTLEFAWGTDMDLAGIDVREKLDLLQLPLEAKRPLLLRFDPASEPVMRLAFTDKAAVSTPDAAQARLRDLRRFAEDRLKPELESVEGSAAVKVSGGYEDEIQIHVDQQKLAQLGLSIDAVTRRVRAENVNLSGGRLEQGTQRFLVRTLNEFQSIEQMANAIIATVGGRPVYLRDVARVTHGHKDREAITRVNGRECIELAVYKEGDANTVQLASGVRKKLEEDREGIPAAGAGRRCLRPVALHRRRDRRSEVRRRARRPAGDRRAVSVPARCAHDAHHQRRDPGLGRRHVHADVHVGLVAEHHVARRPGAGGRHAGRQRRRGSRSDRAQARARPFARRGGAAGHARGFDCRDCSDADVGRRVLPDGVHLRHRRPALQGSGADGHVFAAAVARCRAHAGADACGGRRPGEFRRRCRRASQAARSDLRSPGPRDRRPAARSRARSRERWSGCSDPP